MLSRQLAGEVRHYEGRERYGAPIRAGSNRKFPELEMLQLVENIERHGVLIANSRGSR